MKTTRRSSLALAAVAAWLLASGARAQEQPQRLEKIPGMRDDSARQLKHAYQLNNRDPEVVAALRRIGVVPGPSLKEVEKLASPSVPKGPLPEVDIKRWQQARQAGTASAAEATTAGPRD